MFVNNFITSTDLKAYLTWKLQIAITNPKAYFFLNYHLLNIRNNLHYIMINFYLNKTRLNGGQVAPHIVHRLKIKRAKREKRHRLQTTDMTSLACQILLLARNGSRYFYRSFFFFFSPLREPHREDSPYCESMESLRSYTMYIFARPAIRSTTILTLRA